MATESSSNSPVLATVQVILGVFLLTTQGQLDVASYIRAFGVNRWPLPRRLVEAEETVVNDAAAAEPEKTVANHLAGPEAEEIVIPTLPRRAREDCR
ncbi:hypothetical protein B0T24DRAFT_643587 [Lasiosphaeria ovina]|uniref:Uncharacterized protein n=1 Tax=Lasiosphaeria ovina TaxID=92902 RepID=A0AAE0JSM6_9PEZI|nr:hypothetical protein B0T24DRAFT_643587 [Lasiosphaeria ovina]